jgi:hypothetical protein
MLPASGRVSLPMGFSPADEPSPKSDSDDLDLEALTNLAYREWEGIKIAFETIKEHFGPEFEALDSDLYPKSMSPFGDPLRYRTYSIAGIRLNYNMGMIVLHRAHPEMPPVAMMAAGMSAKHTMGYALEIGRIAAGLEENISILPQVSTLVGAALIESSFCLFVAGIQVQYSHPLFRPLSHRSLNVLGALTQDIPLTQILQYQSDVQRHWLIRRLHDTARLTGWQSARQIADGCESAWTKAASRNRGPPYTRAPDIKLETMKSVWGLPRRIDRRISEIDGKIVLAKAEKAHYALGLLSVQEDLERLDLESGDKER